MKLMRNCGEMENRVDFGTAAAAEAADVSGSSRLPDCSLGNGKKRMG